MFVVTVLVVPSLATVSTVLSGPAEARSGTAVSGAGVSFANHRGAKPPARPPRIAQTRQRAMIAAGRMPRRAGFSFFCFRSVCAAQ